VVEKEVRLIDARKIANDIALYLAETSYLNSTALDALIMVFRWVREAPTIDPESLRPKGKWLKSEWGYPDRTLTCSACGFEYDSAYYKQKLFRYCPNCGTKLGV
jgi:hypothetical protein